jgi:hypothetical protein
MSRMTLTTAAAALAGVMVFAAAGCTPASLGYLLRDSKAKPEHPLPANPDKKEIAVLIIGSQSQRLGMDPMFSGVDRQLPGLIARQMMEDTRREKHPIVAIEQAKLDRWKQTSGQDIRTANPARVGKELGADYVIDLTVNSMTVFQPELAKEIAFRHIPYDSYDRMSMIK